MTSGPAMVRQGRVVDDVRPARDQGGRGLEVGEVGGVDEHRGSWLRVFTLRNRIEDQEIQLKWKDTLSLAADLGTKLFSIKRFKFLRDLVNGYALARASGKTILPSMAGVLEWPWLGSSNSKRKRKRSFK